MAAKLTPKERKILTECVRVVVNRATGYVHYTRVNGMASKVQRRTYESLLSKGLILRTEQTAHHNVYAPTVVPNP